MNKITINKKINPCFLTVSNLATLAEVAYSRYQEELQAANKEWEEIKRPQVIKKIEAHNRALKKSKISYIGYTSLPIDNPDNVIDKEKQYFMSTEKGFQTWRVSTFKLFFKDKTLESNDPGIVQNVDDADKLQSIEFETQSMNGENRVKISINKNKASYFEITGEDESWVRATKDKISEVLKDNEFDKQALHLDSFKFPMAFVLSGLGVYTYFSLINKFNLTNYWDHKATALWISILISVIIFFWLVRIFYIALDSVFPYLQLEKRRTQSTDIGIAVVIFLGLLTNSIFELIKWIFG